MNLLIEDIPDPIVAALDQDAGRLGLDRGEYLRLLLADAVTRGPAEPAPSGSHHASYEAAFTALSGLGLAEQAWR